MSHIVTEACIETKDKACIKVCPVNCISLSETQAYINPFRCIDCGACIAACPMSAIFHETDVPKEWEYFIKLNKNYFIKDIVSIEY